ncbi:hypothetical protein V1477_012088 [Vespula maculifrons]|uniref:Uncharacterized protein n=1 Tax=Vespula maculifrons TaxID=7453 RepID=A0ABD2BWH0_VESMC
MVSGFVTDTWYRGSFNEKKGMSFCGGKAENASEKGPRRIVDAIIWLLPQRVARSVTRDLPLINVLPLNHSDESPGR